MVPLLSDFAEYLGSTELFFFPWECRFAQRSLEFIPLFLRWWRYSHIEGSRLGSWMPIFLFRVDSVFIAGKLNIAWIRSAYTPYRIYFIFLHCPLDDTNLAMHLKTNEAWFLNWRRLWSCKHFMLTFKLHKILSFNCSVLSCLVVQLFKREAWWVL